MLQCINRIKGGYMLKQVIVVEGKSDIQRIAQAVDADCIATEGFTLRRGVIDMIRVAYEKRGIIILTDPDTAGERIRRVLTKKFPNAQHAFVPRDEAFANDDIGIEQASPESIRKALSTLHVESLESSNEFTMVDLVRHGLSGMPDSAARRAVIGAKLGIGYGNASPEVVHYICKRFDIKMSKKLGQNFLIKRGIVDEIVHAAEITVGEPVLEVGPGIGTLTQGLAQSGADVTAIELDRRLLEVLDTTLASYYNVRIIHGDVLKLDVPTIMNHKPFKVVANLPYYITTPIIMSLLESKLPIERLVVMVQKEVALRMIAKPGTKDYGALSVAVQYYTEPDIVLDVPPKSFLPAPAVTSSVIRCVLRDKPPVDVIDEKLFFRVVKAGFAQRRKTFSNTMKTTGLTRDRIEELLAKANIDGQRRGETFTLQEFADVANAWAALIK